jgi:type VI secretion system protein ImpG
VDPRIIDLYNEELLHLRTEAAEFAREFPDRAARLAIDEHRVEDPYVERLLEGVAYLAARVRLKLDTQYPVFTQQLVDVLFPGWLAPSPSACVLRLNPDMADGQLAEGVVVPRGSCIVGSLRGNSDMRCEFETARDLQLLPLQIVAAQYVAARPEAAPAGPQAREAAASSLRLELELLGDASFQALPLDRLPLFVTAADAYGAQLMELLGGRCVAVGLSATPLARQAHAWLPGSAVRHIGFEESESLLRVPVRGHAGFRVLKEYAALPDRFRFVEITGLRQALQGFKGRKLHLHLHFAGAFQRLENAVKPQTLSLFCVPAVNLRERQLDRIDVAPGQMEYHLVADRMRPRHHEVVHVTEVTGGGSGFERRFAPMFEVVSSGRLTSASFYTLRRERRMLTQSETIGRAVTYPGSETYMSIAEQGAPPYGSDLRYLSVRALCSNRDQPLYLRAQFSDARYQPVDTLPVKGIECLAGPSLPLASPTDGFDPWVALSHLFVNYLSLFDSGGPRGADVLRAMLSLYAPVPGHFLLRQADGLNSVAAEQITRRVPGGGPLAFGRGVALRLSMNDRAFDGGSPFLLAAVLENYLASHVAINSFVETTLEMSDRAEQLTWPTRFGRRPTF